MNRLRADCLLLITAVIWGTGFIAQKHAVHLIGSISFVGARFALAAVSIVPLVWWEARRAPRSLRASDFGLAGLIGLCLFFGSWLQQLGLVTTSATNAGFLTSLYVVLVPLVTWAMMGEKPRTMVVLACFVAIAGAWCLARPELGGKWVVGDFLVLLADVAWALAITLVAVFLKRSPRPFFLSFLQYAVTAILGLSLGFAFENLAWVNFQVAVVPILYGGLVAGSLAFTLQVLAQKHTPPAEAALIMSLESVFAASAGAWLLGEHLRPLGWVGCLLILFGVILAELHIYPPGSREFKKTKQSH